MSGYQTFNISENNAIRTAAFNSITSKDNKDLSKTKLCIHFKVGCPNLSTCTFAHSKEELKPVMCRFSTTCRKPDCWFFHQGDNLPSADDLLYNAMRGMKFIEKPRMKIPKMVRTEFIIQLGDDDDEEKEQEISQIKQLDWDELVEEMKKDCVIKDDEEVLVEKKITVQFEVEMNNEEEINEILAYLQSKKINTRIISQ
jgi:hypothetical protein